MIFAKVIFLIAVILFSTPSFSQLSFNFNSGDENWRGAGGLPSTTWVAEGGAEGSGYLQSTDLAGGQMFLYSPTIGDVSYSENGNLSFAYNVFALLNENNYVPNGQFGTVILYRDESYVGADLIADIPKTADARGTGWHSASLRLSEVNWSGNNSLSYVLGDITRIEIFNEYNTSIGYPDEVVGIDNVAFSISAVPESNASFYLVAGLFGIIARLFVRDTLRVKFS